MSSDFAPLPFEPGYRRVAAAIASRIHNRSLREGRDVVTAGACFAKKFITVTSILSFGPRTASMRAVCLRAILPKLPVGGLAQA